MQKRNKEDELDELLDAVASILADKKVSEERKEKVWKAFLKTNPSSVDIAWLLVLEVINDPWKTRIREAVQERIKDPRQERRS